MVVDCILLVFSVVKLSEWLVVIKVISPHIILGIYLVIDGVLSYASGCISKFVKLVGEIDTHSVFIAVKRVISTLFDEVTPMTTGFNS